MTQPIHHYAAPRQNEGEGEKSRIGGHPPEAVSSPGPWEGQGRARGRGQGVGWGGGGEARVEGASGGRGRHPGARRGAPPKRAGPGLP